ncbi:uncharacterized protein LOC120010562 [Tripterygium wilfordii]|uniref:uncharacterized protein LOC120010562 n=1 Tax=Tripterygium wilfordii TaxID=458696 RepID=UPI0018F856B8|nr:uncharacterized protein LOC120010562 [Tripterygium wilfordii]
MLDVNVGSDKDKLVYKRDSNGAYICLFSCNVGVCESNEAEFMALRKALHLTVTQPSLSLKNIIVETDSQSVHSWATRAAEVPWKFSQLMNAVEWANLQLTSVSLKHIRREGNQVADLLAKGGGVGRSSDHIVWFGI